MAIRRAPSISMSNDDYSVTETYWELFKNSPTSVRTKRRSLLRGKSVHFNYLDSRDKKTPLMKSVEKNYIRKTMDILLFGADPNIQHETTGDTALHMAVDNGNLTQVKLLLLFDADPTIRNNHWETPLDVADLIKDKTRPHSPTIKVALKFAAFKMMAFDTDMTTRSKREIKDEALKGDIDGIIKVLTEATRLQAKSHDYFTKHSTIPTPRNSSDKYLLSLDGGGVKVFNVLQAIVNIEKRMFDLTSTKRKFDSYFDYVGGTSSGGLAACMLKYLDSDAFNCRALCLKVLLDVRLAPPDQRGEKMDAMLQDLFTEERNMCDLDPQHRVIVTASLAEYTPYELHLMTSYGEPRNKQAGPRERKVWEACRITTAAPAFFPVLRDLKLLHGGLLCNNPTLDCMSEILDQINKEGQRHGHLSCVVSIGTGILPKKESQEVEFFLTSALSFLSVKNIHALQSLIQHFVNQTMLSDGLQVTNAQTFCQALDCRYFRLTPLLKEEVGLDIKEEAIIIDMLYNTQMYYLDRPELIDNVAKCLLSK